MYYHVKTNYDQLKPNDRFTVRYDNKLMTWQEYLEAKRHGLCKVLSDMWAANQHDSKVSFTLNYPVWKWQA
ncbi:hypothetical protein LCGC14_0346050 [marine sediment metagenome]|uniref:Uncharacterized protein n=1 Tax=marine sediment metagenome TaxID=412755 RepID=A0A0F9WK44_9ZZZZ